jgi:hypothetical protein
MGAREVIDMKRCYRYDMDMHVEVKLLLLGGSWWSTSVCTKAA